MKTMTSQTKYEPVPRWAKLPMGVTFRGDATSIAVDSKDNVYVFNRGTEPIAVFDVDGNFLRGMGHDEFVRPQGIECVLSTYHSQRDLSTTRMPSSA